VTGPSKTREAFSSHIYGFTIFDGYPPPLVGHVVYIDHNEIRGWTEAAVVVQMYATLDAELMSDGLLFDCAAHVQRPAANVHVIANYIHHNQLTGEGYGVVLIQEGYAEIIGNVFDENRHAIASDGTPSAGYIARNNVVTGTFSGEQAFDMHGTTADPHYGGIGGGQVDISSNTFLRIPDWAFASRGEACAQESFANNFVVNRNLAQSIEWFHPKNSQEQKCQAELHVEKAKYVKHDSSCGNMAHAPPLSPPAWLTLPAGTQFNAPNPTNRLGTGDFDGDGYDDLFLATGAGWYYSPSGATEWRFLSGHTERLDKLLLGDFDGDGRTDVLSKIGDQWFISWGGLSDWELFNQLDKSQDAVSEYAVGHFVSPQSTDLFHANGHNWFISAGGRAAFSEINTSSYRIANLRFGDFDGDGKTDVLGFEAGRWRISSGAASAWSTQPLNPNQLSTSVADLVVGDFDGDGQPDIAQGTRYSSAGRSPWTSLLKMDVSKAVAPPGHFRAGLAIQIATFVDNSISIASMPCCELR
jgi:hypothetical protein